MTQSPNFIDLLVGGNVRRWRLERGVTALDVAVALRVSAALLEKMEAGYLRFGVEDIRELCTLLQIAPAALYEGHRDDAPPG